MVKIGPGQSEPLIHTNVLEGKGATQKSGAEATAPRPDQYGTQLLNRVMQNIRQLVTLRPSPQHSPHSRLAQQEDKKDLSLFEKIFLARFKDGASLEGRPLPQGHYRFKDKSDEDWKDFFKRLADYVYDKEVSMEDIKEIIYRGLTKDKKLIADVVLQTGKKDKFAQTQVDQAEIVKILGELTPGDAMADTLIQELGLKGALLYQALSHKKRAMEQALQSGDPMALALHQQALAVARAAQGRRKSTEAVSSQAGQLAAEGLDFNEGPKGIPKNISKDISENISEDLSKTQPAVSSKNSKTPKTSWPLIITILLLVLGISAAVFFVQFLS